MKRAPRARSWLSRPIPISGPRTSRAYVGLTVFTMSARRMPSRSRSIPHSSPAARVRAHPQVGDPLARGPAVVGEVVDGHGHRRGSDHGVVGVDEVPQEHGRAGVPVVEGDDVDRPPLGAPRLEGSPAEQPEAPCVVGIVAGGIAVEAGPVERRRVIDEAEAIARGLERTDGDLAHPAGGARIGHAQGEGLDGSGPSPTGTERIAREEDLDRLVENARDAAERPGQRVDDVAEPAASWPTARTRRR